MTTNLYPKSPVSVPENFTSLTSSYKLKAFLAIFAVLVFFLLYFALVAAFSYLAFLAIMYPVSDYNAFSILLKVGAVLATVMLVVFSLKFIFKIRKVKPENRIKLTPSEHPQLVSFVEEICKETGAPAPRHIYIDPDVNAYVMYSNIWLSLIFPTKKDLTIGLGLVDSLTLSEFKAVIAHEFGHFAQRSMRVGSYILSANTIIHDMIFSRDKWDEVLDGWRSLDLRLSAAAWLITPLIWLVRQLLGLFYRFLNMMYSALSREMEFNADKYAVKVSGSEAIVRSLWKLEPGLENWSRTISHAYVAANKNIFTRNLYHHNALAHSRTKSKVESAYESLVKDERGGALYFQTSDHSKVAMYASHPPNNLREGNAKTPFLDCEEDERSPWLLFGNKEALQQKMTELVYRTYLQKEPKEFLDTEAFESFIQEEEAGKEIMEEYHNAFVDRFLTIPDSGELEKESGHSPGMAKGLKTELYDLMAPIRDLDQLIAKAQSIAEGTSKEKQLVFQGISYKKKQLGEVYSLMMQERNKLLENHFMEWDKKFCVSYFSLAKSQGKENELKSLYSAYTDFGNFYKKLLGTRAAFIERFNNLLMRTDVAQVELTDFKHDFNGALQKLNEDMDAWAEADFVPLPNIPNLKELREAIIQGGSFVPGDGSIFENGEFDRMVNSIEKAVSHCLRIDQKRIIGILEFHKSLEDSV